MRSTSRLAKLAALFGTASLAALAGSLTAQAQQPTTPTQPRTDWAEQLLERSQMSVWPVRSLRCIFSDGYTAAWNASGDVTLQANAWSGSPEPVFFDNINAPSGTARFIGNVGATDVLVIPSVRNVVFLERTPAGNLVMTTVYGGPRDGNWFPAVMSRHLTLIDSPIASSYHGRCLRTD